MATPKSVIKTAFDAVKTIQPIYTGGKVALDESGRILVTTLNEEVLITDFETGDELARIEGDEEVVTTLALTPNASHLCICSRSQTMRIYALNPTESPLSVTPRLLRSVKAHEAPVIVCDVDPTGTLLATGGAESQIKLWDINGGYITHTFKGHGGVISALKFYAPEGTDNSKWMLASGADDTTVRVWSLQGRKCLAVLQSHVSVVRGLDWTKDGKILASGSRDKVVCLWDTKSWKCRNTIPVLEELETVGFLKAEEGETQVLYTGGQKNRVRLWDINKGQELTEEVAERDEHESLGISDIVYHKSLSFLLSVHNDQVLLQHSLPPVSSSSGLTLTLQRHISGYHDEIIDLAFIGPTQSHLALASNSETLRIIDPSSFGDIGILEGHSEIVLTLDVDSTGTYLASAGKDNEARLWRLDLENKKFPCIARCTGHAESIAALSLSKSNHDASKPPAFLVTGSQDRTIKLWDFTTGKPRAVHTRRAHDKDINAIDVSPDDALFASASQDKTVKIWDRASCEVIGVLRGHKRGVWTVRFAPSTANGATLGGESGKLIATGSGDKTVKIWSLASYTCLRTFEGHSASVLKLLWISQGTQVVSAGGDALVKVWDLKKGEESITLDNHSDRVWALAGKDDGGVIVSGGGDSTVTLWEDVTEKTVLEGKAKEKQKLKEEQTLQNLVATRNYRAAIALALSLDRPGQLLSIFQSALTASPDEADDVDHREAVKSVIADLSDNQLTLLLSRVRDWNTSAKTADISQAILNMVLRTHDLSALARRISASYAQRRKRLDAGEEGAEEEEEEVLGRRNPLGKGGVVELVRALERYTEKHYGRVEALVEEGWALEYTLGRMGQVGV